MATCETHGHLYGAVGTCMMCGAPAPPGPTPHPVLTRAEAEQRAESAEATVAALRVAQQALDNQTDYSIGLMRLIEDLASGRGEFRTPKERAPHLHAVATRVQERIDALAADLTRAERRRDRFHAHTKELLALLETRSVDLARAREESASWRRVAEHLETEKVQSQAQVEALRAAVASLIERAMRELDTAKGKNLMARGMVLALQMALAESAALAPQPSAPAKEEA